MMRAVLIALLVLGLLPADAATLRLATTLHGPTVLLRDLFDDAGPGANRVLGPGPGPGGRIIVEAPQLGAIARQFDVDWQPSSKADRTVLEWPGEPMKREDALDATRAALVAAGASPDCTIELLGFTPPLVPVGAKPRAVVMQLDYDNRTGRFTAILSVAGEGMDPVNTRISGHVEEMVEVPVATSRLTIGTVLRPEDVQMGRVSVSSLHGDATSTIDQTVGMQLKHAVLAGQPLVSSDLVRPSLVLRGALVQLRLEADGLSLTGQGVALESGAVGEHIKVRNPGSRAILDAEVIGPNVVRVSPNASSPVSTLDIFKYPPPR